MRRWDFLAATGLLTPPSIVIALHIYIGSFNRMLGDDYCSMYIGQRLGLLRSIWYWYKSWHGGFSASVADWLLSLLGPGALPFHTLVFLSIWVVFAALAARQALHSRGYSSHHPIVFFSLAVFLVFTTLGLSPDIIESLFWWGGARGYVSPLVLSILYAAVYYYFETSSAKRVHIRVWSLISFGLAFFIGGFSETFTPVFVVLLAGLTMLRGLRCRFSIKNASMLFLGAGFVGSVFSLLVMMLAPGNSIRQGYFPAPPDAFTILRVAFVSFLGYLSSILASPYQLTGLLGSTLGSVWLGIKMNRENGIASPGGWRIFAVLLTGLVLAFGCFPPAVYGTSEPPPERTLIAPAFLLVTAFLVAGFSFGEWVAPRSRQGTALLPTLLVLACGLVFFSASGMAQKLYAMDAEHIEFAQRWDEVDAQIRAAKNSGLPEVHIPSLTNWADAEYPTDNPKYWPNVCYSDFYDINVLAPPRQPE